eukprot:GILJ01015468.1.p1 GENE.GILJ01015468.1~~GILJ01015468.1.p1  ORF type:complete len:352 (+),score=64.01 GILJ01015468.1:1-1056(+)
MADWWNFAPGRFDSEAYERRRKELAIAEAAEEKRLEVEEQLIEQTADPQQQLKLRRDRYECQEYVTVGDLQKWSATVSELQVRGLPKVNDYKASVTARDTGRRFPCDPSLNEKVFLYQGDITELEIDGIVNAANSSLLGGGGIDGAIHSAAGPLLVKECRHLKGCESGNTKVTKGYSLPAKYVLHTVGPYGRGDAKLHSCYTTCLEVAREKGIRSLAFCCVGTGIYSFPLVRAAHIALRCVRQWLEASPDAFDAIIFCVFQNVELAVYQCVMPSYFPVEGFPAVDAKTEDQDLYPVTEASARAEAAAERQEEERHNAYYRKWVASSPADVDDELKGSIPVPRTESGTSLTE